MRAKTILLLLIALLFTSVVSAQTRYPKREFRGAWIQCVNGQFQGMPTEKIQCRGECLHLIGTRCSS